MGLFGVGLGPGEHDLVTVRGKEILEGADVVYSPGRLSRSVATAHVPDDRIGDVDFPMTRDEAELKRAWKEAAAAIAPRARSGTAAFVTLGDPNVYSTFGHLRRTLAALHPDVEVSVVPGVSAVTAFTSALGVEIASGASLVLREAARGGAPVGPDRMVLFKVTDVPTTHEKLIEAGYEVVYGRRLFMEQGQTRVTNDPEAVADRDYYTLAYAEKRGLDSEPVTATFEGATTDDGPPNAERTRRADGGTADLSSDSDGAIGIDDGETEASGAVAMERVEGVVCGDEPSGGSR